MILPLAQNSLKVSQVSRRPAILLTQPRDGEEKNSHSRHGETGWGGEGRVAQDDMVYSVREGDMGPWQTHEQIASKYA